MKTMDTTFQAQNSIFSILFKIKRNKIISYLLSEYNYILIPGAFLVGRAGLAGGLMPFGFSFFGATKNLVKNRLIIALSVLLGVLSNGEVDQLYITGAAMFLYMILGIPIDVAKNNAAIKYSFLAFICILLPHLILAGLQGFLLYDILRGIFCSFICFVSFFVFRNTLTVLSSIGKKNIYGNEEMICIAITAALVVSGIGYFKILGFSLQNLICIFIILVFSFKCGPGVGAAAGVAIGLIISMSSELTPLFIGTYAFCGLLAGIFRGFGKIGAGLGFVLGNSILAIYLDSSAEALIYFKEIILSVIVFIAVPNKFLDRLAWHFSKDAGSYSDKSSYTRRIRDITIEKLEKFSRAFKELSKTFGEISQTKIVTDKQDISVLFDKVAERVCRDCSLCLHCWDRNFYSTYQVMFKIVEVLEAKGRIDESGIPEYFLERCERINDFVDSINCAYELFKVDMVWKSRIGESRSLISQQFEGLSNVISSLADEIDADVNFVKTLEDEVYIKLENAGAKVKEVVVYKTKWDKYEVGILHSGCGGARVCVSAIEKVVSGILGRQMVKDSEECKKARDGMCLLKLVEEEVLKISVSVAKLPKYGSEISGDSFSFMNSGNGKYIIALSDGMGSGYRASVQSKAAISLLENFLESGFDKDTAVKLVNSVLVMKSSEDSFSTMDISIVDLFTGETEFVKIGAPPAYLKKNEKVEVIRSASLPAGILGNLDTELMRRSVEHGDMLIMVTDGIIDSFEGEGSGDRMLMKFIQDFKSINPQQLADSILENACLNCENKPMDDMTVLVGKVWKSYK